MQIQKTMFTPVIISGGSGTRLWPISRDLFPKQFSYLFEKNLMTQTLDRIAPLGVPWVITGKTLKHLTEKSASNYHPYIVYEPFGKNTAPAIALLCHLKNLKGGNEDIVGVFPADHIVEKTSVFLEAVQIATAEAKKGLIVTLGIQPHEPATGYGYIQLKNSANNNKNHNNNKAQDSTSASSSFNTNPPMDVSSVVAFHEKPKLETAVQFLKDGHYVWNAGIFIFKVSKMIEHFQNLEPKLWAQIQLIKEDLSNIESIYTQLESNSIDYAILEKLNQGELACVPGEFGWNDVGTWDSMAELNIVPKDLEKIEINAKNNYAFYNHKKLFSFLGVDDLIVVDSDDALLITRRGQSQNVRQIVDHLKHKKSPLVYSHSYEERPWGNFQVLRDSTEFKSKVIEVDSGQQISYQSHSQREEHWIIVKGQGEVVLNDRIIPVTKGTHVHIPVGAKHRIRNTGSEPLSFVEVQLGSYFGEDDIIRYKDDYQRT
ncbi:MAG TPA: mannose-1-phosphate guanylyltransferase/mannose-6-phosphate isomerase [Pseudobdellovibrionaceae bacterium]|nr:mannose-1-phosphate guanylyltransferase/mannose-6-phosphate isomerase [Pseudobdellovibrionaceae bacterium]